jgi:hypothetical protein
MRTISNARQRTCTHHAFKRHLNISRNLTRNLRARRGRSGNMVMCNPSTSSERRRSNILRMGLELSWLGRRDCCHVDDCLLGNTPVRQYANSTEYLYPGYSITGPGNLHITRISQINQLTKPRYNWDVVRNFHSFCCRIIETQGYQGI